MLEIRRQHRISLNLRKCIFCVSFGILLGHIVCKEGMLVDPTNIALIVNLPPPTNVKQLGMTLGHMGYYRKFIRGYVAITMPMEKLLKKYVQIKLSHECQGSIDTLNKNMVATPILVSSYWMKEFLVHVDASSIALGMVLVQSGEGDIDHLIYFSSQKLSYVEKNYTTNKREGLVMVYALQNFLHY